MATSRDRMAAVRIDLVVLWCIIGLGLGIAIALALPAAAPTGDGLPPNPSGITLPNPAIAPEEVVRLQLQSLRDFRDDDSAILQCFVLASPANREATGPLGRFAAMVRNPKYVALVDCESELVGKMIVRGDRATVLVTVVDPQQRASLFRFFLSKQTEEPFRNCWMTDAVVAAETTEPPAPPPPPSVSLPPDAVNRFAAHESLEIPATKSATKCHAPGHRHAG